MAMPTSITEFLSVEGAENETKWERFGKGFLAITKKYAQQLKKRSDKRVLPETLNMNSSSKNFPLPASKYKISAGGKENSKIKSMKLTKHL